MRSRLVIVLFLLTIVVPSIISAPAQYENKPERECVVGKSYYDGCNWCSCVGGLARTACTLKACVNYDMNTGTIKEVEQLEPPDDYWKKE